MRITKRAARISAAAGCCLAALLTIPSSASAQQPEPSVADRSPARSIVSSLLLERAEQLHALMSAIGPEIVNQVSDARERLETFPAAEGWTDDLKASVRTWFTQMLATGQGAPVAAEMTLLQQDRIFLRSRYPVEFPTPASFYLGEVNARLLALRQLRLPLWAEYTNIVSQIAEQAWLNAKTPTELETAVRALRQFQKFVPEQPNPGDPRYPQPLLVDQYVSSVGPSENEVLSGLALLSGAEPLLLPDPLEALDAYRAARLKWSKLSGWDLRFCDRYQIVARVTEYDFRYRALALQAQRQLERLIIENAPLEKITAELARFEKFRPAAPSTGAARPPLPPPMHEMNQLATVPIDSRLLQSQISGPRSTPFNRASLPQEVFFAYRNLVNLLTGEKTAEKLDFSSVSGLKAWNHYSPALQTWIQGRFPVDSFGRPNRANDGLAGKSKGLMIPTAPGGISAFDTVQVLLQTAAAYPPSEATEAAKSLALSWAGLKTPNTNPFPPAQDWSRHWSKLAELPNGPSLIAARNRAVLELITAQGAPVPTEPALPILRDRLEQCVAAADFACCARIISIDQVANILPQEERNEWQNLERTLRVLSTGDEAANEIQLRYNSYALLQQTRSAAAAKLVVERLKKSSRSREEPTTRIGRGH